MACTLVIVDDHADFRTTAVTLMEEAGFEVIAVCDDARSAVSAIVTLRPDVVLLDIHLPDGDGFDVIRQLDAAAVDTAVVLISTREAQDFGPRLGECGAAGFITKSDLSGGAIKALTAVR